MRVYYAHCMQLYDTPQEARDIATLEAMGFEVVNPNVPEVAAQCDAIRNGPLCGHTCPMPECGACYVHCWAGPDPSQTIMDHVFRPLVQSCAALAFRALPDLRITSGVMQEVYWAKEKKLPVIELPGFCWPREMSIEDTKRYLFEVGER